MINTVIYYVSLILAIVFFIIIIFQFLKINKLNEMNAKLAASIPRQTPFDSLVGTNKGMDVVHSFLRTNFLKFINSKLITLNENSETPITEFLNQMRSSDELAVFSTGFVGFINVIMSNDMKLLFNRYYNILDEGGQTNEIFIKYVTEWFIMSIREIQAELAASNTQEDYSIERNIRNNSIIFADIEMSLYKDLKIISEQPVEKK